MIKQVDPPIFKTDAELIAGMLAGESAAFEMAVAQYHNRMLTIAKAIIGDAFAEEIVQDAWLSAIRSLKEFSGRCSLQTWLIQITANAAKTRLRREKRQVSLDVNWQQKDDRFDHTDHWKEHVSQWDIDTPEAIMANHQLSEIIQQTFDQLSPQQQAVLTLYDLEGESMAEICNILAISASNARVLLHRARSTIHQQIRHYQETI
jgi:RNA polymerase sigma-70 factor (ECF subfamily)